MRNLLIITCGGVHYGVWKDAVSSVVGALPLHRLPLSPPAIAGVALFEDRSAVIADLGACLGCPPLKKPREGTFLIISAGDLIAGFCAEGKVDGFECAPELVRSLPPVVATSVADTCAVRGASLIPIINIRNLHDRLKQGLLDVPSPEPGPPARACDLSGVRGVRVFSVGGARFCVDAGNTEFTAFGEGGVAPVPVRSQRLAGVALHDGEIVPVMLPGALLGIRAQHVWKGILLAGPQGARYGIAVDQDLGIVEGRDLKMLALPVLAAKPWFPAAVLAQGQIRLLVDIGLFEAIEEIAGERPRLDGFKPASQFPTQFRKSATNVVEFSLLGARHAVPQEEMKDDLAVLPFVPVPGTPEIVLGVAELRGELLPVLDLAAIFGRRIPIVKGTRMMHIVNGDFQALVATDEIAGNRHLPVESQRQVPIALPHQVLYGCYLEAGMVRLILNVESLAVHFEKTSVRELVASLSQDIAVRPEQTQQALEQAAPVASAAETVPQTGEAPRFDQDQDAVMAETETGTAPTDAGDAVRAAALDEERERNEARIDAAAEAAARELARQRVEAEKLRAEDEARSRAAEQALLRAEAKALEEKRRHEEAERSAAEAEARSRREAEARSQEQETMLRKAAEEAANKEAEEARKEGEEESRRKAEDMAREAAAVAAGRAAEEAEHRRAAEEAMRQAAEEARVRAEEDAREREREAARQQAAEEALKREEAEARRKAEEPARLAAAENIKRKADEAQQRQEAQRRAEAAAAKKRMMAPEPTTKSRFSPEPGSEEFQPAARRERVKHISIASVMALLLVLVISFVSLPKKTEQQAPSKPEKAEKQAAARKSSPQPENEPPLYLAVPPGKAVPAPFVYTVVKDDNLWNISKRFTGNPLNFPRVAKDNSIATPDLIFPGRRILIKNELVTGR
jgi:chemotaxis signal transduction protein/nucleoid-associated protein YgaU